MMIQLVTSECGMGKPGKPKNWPTACKLLQYKQSMQDLPKKSRSKKFTYWLDIFADFAIKEIL